MRSIGHTMEAVPDSLGSSVVVPLEGLKGVALQAKIGHHISVLEVASLWAPVLGVWACEIEADIVDMKIDCSSAQQEDTGY